MKKRLFVALLFVFALFGIMTQTETNNDEITVQKLDEIVLWGDITPMDFDDDDFPEYWLYNN